MAPSALKLRFQPRVHLPCRVVAVASEGGLGELWMVPITHPMAVCLIERVGDGVATLSALADGSVVAVKQGRLLATSFHPELTADRRCHRYFLSLAGANSHS